MEPNHKELVLTKPKPREQAPPGIYEAVLDSWEDLGQQSYGGYSPKHTLRLVFVLNKLDSKGEYYSVSKLATASLNRKSHLYSIVMALRGDVPNNLRMSELVGSSCRVVVSQRRDDQGHLWSNIDSVIAPEVPPPPPGPPPRGFLFNPSAKPAAGENFTLSVVQENQQ